LPPDASSSPVLLQLNTQPDAVKRQVEWGLRNGGPYAVATSDTLIELTLSGYITDWTTVRSICQTATRLWNAVLYDETGFAFRSTIPPEPSRRQAADRLIPRGAGRSAVTDQVVSSAVAGRQSDGRPRYPRARHPGHEPE